MVYVYDPTAGFESEDDNCKDDEGLRLSTRKVLGISVVPTVLLLVPFADFIIIEI
jgi:hypothetical protein